MKRKLIAWAGIQNTHDVLKVVTNFSLNQNEILKHQEQKKAARSNKLIDKES